MKDAVGIDWPIKADRYVSYFDIMGFKDMVARTTHDKIYEMMKSIIKKIESAKEANWLGPDIRLVRTATYSDSIFLYSKNDSFNSLYSLICATAALTSSLLRDAIPHKGAVAFGTMTLDTGNSIFFGQPLIDAYLLQEDLNFYGIIVHSSFEQKLEEKGKEGGIPFIQDYLCPLKNGNAIHKTILPIFANIADPDHQEFNDELFASFKKLRFKTSGHLREYIDNTELYLNSFKRSAKAGSIDV